MGAPVDVSVVLERAGVLEELAALVAVVAAHGVGRQRERLPRHAVDVVHGAHALVRVHLAVAVADAPERSKIFSLNAFI